MTSKLIDIVIYMTATIVILALIVAATRAERDYDKQKEQIDEIEIREPVIKDKPDLTSEIIFTSRPNCSPCKSFERDCVSSLRKAGWRVTRALPDRRATPSFDVRLNGSIVASKTGYRNRKTFFAWVRSVLEKNK